MRSIFLFLASSNSEVRSWLASFFPTTKQKGGYDFEIPGASEPIGWVYQTDDVSYDIEESALDTIKRTLGAPIGCIVVADISGRWASITETTQFAKCILSRFVGLAQDDYSEALWRASQLSSLNDEGRAFFCPGPK